MMWKRIEILCAVCLMASCGFAAAPPDDPSGTGPIQPPMDADVSIAFLKSKYAGHPVVISDDLRIAGTVVSTDRYGNYHKTVAIVDQTAGIELRVDMEEIFNLLHPGYKVVVHCNSLTLGAYGGLVQLGSAGSPGYETGYIGEAAFAGHLQVTGKAEEAPVAERLTIAELAPRYLSCLVRISGVQFSDSELESNWSGDDADADRILEDGGGNTLIVRTSFRADFAHEPLPAGSGYIEGILSWFNDHYQLRVVDPRKVKMTGERF